MSCSIPEVLSLLEAMATTTAEINAVATQSVLCSRCVHRPSAPWNHPGLGAVDPDELLEAV